MSAKILSFSLNVLRRQNLPSIVYVVARQRSTYYANNQKSVVPRFIRSFFYRHPKAPFAIILITCIAVITQPHWKVHYARLMMSQQDYLDFRREANRIFLNRGRHGEDFYLPFYQGDKIDELYHRYMKRSRDRKAGLYVDNAEPTAPNASP